MCYTREGIEQVNRVNIDDRHKTEILCLNGYFFFLGKKNGYFCIE